jgi:methionyl-tRNA formyltransferase
VNKISVVFFGTGPVAAKSLELLAKNFRIEAVITKPKPAHHRGDFPVLDVANQLSLPIHEVTDKQSLSNLLKDSPFVSKIGVLIDFGIIVDQDVIDYFEKGIVNSHFSLLPEWRGADPITFSILSGQEETGVSLMLLVKKMDEGPLLSQSPVTISSNETVDSLTEKLITKSDSALSAVVPLYMKNQTTSAKQEEVTMAASKEPTYSRKLTKSDGIIDWNKSAKQIEREVRAFQGWPKSRTILKDIDVVITKAHVVNESGKPGEYYVEKNTLVIFAEEKALSINALKPSGRQNMDIAGFLAGYKNKL